MGPRLELDGVPPGAEESMRLWLRVGSEMGDTTANFPLHCPRVPGRIRVCPCLGKMFRKDQFCDSSHSPCHRGSEGHTDLTFG